MRRNLVKTLVAAAAVVLLVPIGFASAPAFAAPVAPVLTAPANGSHVTSNPVLEWAPTSGTVKYDVQISSAADFASANVKFSITTANTKATPPNDLAVGTYYWQVRGYDATNAAGIYASSTFVKDTAEAPVVLTPADTAVLAYPSQPIVLSWQPMVGAKTYEVQIDDDVNFVNAANPVSTTNTSYTPLSPPTFGTVSYWRVSAKSYSGVPTQYSVPRSYSMTWSEAPTLLSPLSQNVPTIEEILLKWAPMDGASSYELQISPDALFNVPIGGTRVVNATSFAPNPTLPNGAYYWRVRGLSTSSTPERSQWSSIFVFTRAWPAAAPLTFPHGTEVPSYSFPQVTLLTPLDGAFSLHEPTFTWTPQREAAYYQFQVGTDINFSPSTFDTCTTNRTTFTPSSQCDPPHLNPGVVLYWRVRAVDGSAGVLGVFSEVRQFLYDPTLVVQRAPIGGVTAPVPVLTWDRVDNISRYRVSIAPTPGQASPDPKCVALSVITYNNTYVPETLAPQCVGLSMSWFVQSVENDNDLSRGTDISKWETFVLGALPSAGPSLNPVTTTPIDTYRPPLLQWSVLTGAATYSVWLSVAGASSYSKMNNKTNLPGFSYSGLNTTWSPLLSPGDYSFYVEAFDTNGASIGTSWVNNFHIASLPLTQLLTPVVCVAPCALKDTPTLDWAPVQSAGYYMVYLATDPNFTNITRTWSTVFSTLTPRESLPDSQAGEATYWFVRPCFTPSACGPFDASVFGQAYAFRKLSYPVETIAPVEGSTWADEVQFSWKDYLATNQSQPQGSSVTQEARNYRVQVATTAGFTNIIDTSPFVDQTSYIAQTATYPEGPLFWRVQAFDQSGNPLTFSTPVSFTKSSLAPAQQLPAAAATVNGAPVLLWSPMAFAETYAVEVYRNPASALTPTNLVWSITTRTSAALATTTLPAGTYGWRVRRFDTNGLPGAWTSLNNSGLRLFTVAGPAATLLAPSDGASVQTNTLSLDWAGVAGASRYLVEASTSSAFTSTIQTITTDMTSWAPSLISPVWPNGTIYWRVKTLDATNQVIATSAVWSFVKDSSTAGEFTAVSPFRILDTRSNNTPILANTERLVTVTGGASGVPAAGVSTIVMNVTGTEPTASTFLTVFPANVTRPLASNLNLVAGETRPNLVTVGVDTSGRVKIYNSLGKTHVILDVVGYYSAGTLARATRFMPAVSPTRILDTRGGSGQLSNPLYSGEIRETAVAGVAGVPADATAVVMNVTAVQPTAAGYLTLFPSGQSAPTASSVNFRAGAVVPNLVSVALGAAGRVSILNALGTTHVIFDVIGWYAPGDPAPGGRLNPVTPARLLDTRLPADAPIFGAGETRAIQVRGRGGVPDTSSATSVVLNLTVTGSIASGYATVYPTGRTLPTASNLNFVAGQTVPNSVIAKIGPDGKINIYTDASVHVIVDVVGWFNG